VTGPSGWEVGAGHATNRLNPDLVQQPTARFSVIPARVECFSMEQNGSWCGWSLVLPLVKNSRMEKGVFWQQEQGMGETAARLFSLPPDFATAPC